MFRAPRCSAIFSGRNSVHRDRNRRYALAEPAAIGDAPDFDTGPLGQRFQKLGGERRFVGCDCRHPGMSKQASALEAGKSGVERGVACTDVGEIIHSRGNPGQAFVVLRAGLPPVGKMVGTGRSLYAGSA